MSKPPHYLDGAYWAWFAVVLVVIVGFGLINGKL